MCIVRRLKTLRASEQDLSKVLRAQVLSVLQFSTPAWSTLLTAVESARIESDLKTGLFLVYGERDDYFIWALKQAQMFSLENQRTKVFRTFTQDCMKSKMQCICICHNVDTIIAPLFAMAKIQRIGHDHQPPFFLLLGMGGYQA